MIVVEVIKLNSFFSPYDIKLFKEFIHILRVEFKIFLHFLYPLLVHFIVVFDDQLPHLELKHLNLLIQIQFNDVPNQQK